MMNIKITYMGKDFRKVKVTYRRKEVINFLHTLHDNSKRGTAFGLYDIEENTRNVNLIFEFKHDINNFKKVLSYINALYNEHLAFEIRLAKRNLLEQEMVDDEKA